MEALVLFGPNAHKAVDNLITASKLYGLLTVCWETRHHAVTALGMIGVDKEKGPAPKILTALYTRFADPSATVRLAAIESLANLGAAARSELKREYEEKLIGLIQ